MTAADIVRVRVGALIDPDADEPVTDGALLIEGERLIAVGPDDRVPRPVDAIELSFPSCSALPGLIDLHVHLTLSAEDDPIARLRAESDDQLIERGRANATRLVRSGVTTAVDRGARNTTATALREVIRGAPGARLRLLVSGRPITPTGGHMDLLGGVADTIDAVRRLVDQQASEGVDAIKIVATGGMLTPSTDPAASAYPTETLVAAVRAAERAGLPLTAHAHGVRGIRQCVSAGIDSIEHATMLDESGKWAFDLDLATAMRVQGVTATPGVADCLDQAAALRAAGVHLLAGTDVGVDGTTWGSEMQRELEGFVAIGYSPWEAIRIATTDAATRIGMADTIGGLRPGHLADVLVVDGRPDLDIGALRTPRLVIAGGTLVEPTMPVGTAPMTTLAAAGF